jgi:hypothetical protein
MNETMNGNTRAARGVRLELNSDAVDALATLRTLMALGDEAEVDVVSAAILRLRDERLAKLRR